MLDGLTSSHGGISIRSYWQYVTHKVVNRHDDKYHMAWTTSMRRRRMILCLDMFLSVRSKKQMYGLYNALNKQDDSL